MTPIRGRVEGKAAAHQGGRAPGAHTGARFQDWCRASCPIKITPIRIQTLHNSAGCRYLKTSAAVTRRAGGSLLPRCFLMFIFTSKLIYIHDPHRKRPSTERNGSQKSKKRECFAPLSPAFCRRVTRVKYSFEFSNIYQLVEIFY